MQPDAAPPRPSHLNLGELILAAAVILFGAAVIWQATRIRLTPAYSLVGPRVIPYIVGAGLLLVGVWLAVEALSGRSAAPSADSEDADPTLPTDWRTVGLLALPLIAYALLIEPAGFVIASALLYVGAAFALGSRRLVRDAAVGIVLALALFVGFTRWLNLDLPPGLLDGLL